jgi:hypothetical protein
MRSVYGQDLPFMASTLRTTRVLSPVVSSGSAQMLMTKTRSEGAAPGGSTTIAPASWLSSWVRKSRNGCVSVRPPYW